MAFVLLVLGIDGCKSLGVLLFCCTRSLFLGQQLCRYASLIGIPFDLHTRSASAVAMPPCTRQQH
ncbi:hypothetical protein LH435_08495 [Laribacter hongkongensis]|uniref:Uncharacterized protein n=1 Tax=Laribacter hongkongensis (strain HLHK9) TaxID=557598 RepID=C1D7V7_LARHH|nr:hypothetical protein [Laribacter hongkongensis]ACO74547.1 hypothetical protein LHK_01559 [Laribacter hongkongensis HLHK9]MCG8994115.1 hypothetical protein [Laribacter hongkongensis]MCG9011030.1 hypothetical protein [Laribacter hongkongensis]MCG9021522.1 hypothetical protein [Laribacter hongkongensis]MCG9045864.1 hypothetical protein [Laribacter hongkongensis]